MFVSNIRSIQKLFSFYFNGDSCSKIMYSQLYLGILCTTGTTGTIM